MANRSQCAVPFAILRNADPRAYFACAGATTGDLSNTAEPSDSRPPMPMIDPLDPSATRNRSTSAIEMSSMGNLFAGKRFWIPLRSRHSYFHDTILTCN